MSGELIKRVKQLNTLSLGARDQLIRDIIVALSPVLPDDVAEILNEPPLSHHRKCPEECQLKRLTDMLKRQQREIVDLKLDLDLQISATTDLSHALTNRYAFIIELEQRIAELTCEHGKGKTEYCEPCGRINGG